MQLEGSYCRRIHGWRHKAMSLESTGSYTSLQFGNPLYYLFGSTLCYVVTGMTILVVGVIITSVTFQNLESHNEGNRMRYSGPVLIGVGLILMGRGALYRIKHVDCRNYWARQRIQYPWLRWIVNHINHQQESEHTTLYLGPTDSELEDLPSYSDAPPPYESIHNRSLSISPVPPSAAMHLVSPLHGVAPSNISGILPPPSPLNVPMDEFGAAVNPALDVDDTDPFPPPPSYEDVIRLQHTKI